MYRPYALTSRLHNNDAMLGVKTCRAARMCCAGTARWRSQPLSQCGGRTGPAVWHAGVSPLAACLAMAHVTVLCLTPNMRGRPFCDVICIKSIQGNVVSNTDFVFTSLMFCIFVMLSFLYLKYNQCMIPLQLQFLHLYFCNRLWAFWYRLSCKKTKRC